MKYLVLIDPASLQAQLYSGLLVGVKCGEDRVPAFLCSGIDPGQPNYIHMEIEPTDKSSQPQSVMVPHSVVVLVVQYEQDVQPPLGFSS